MYMRIRPKLKKIETDTLLLLLKHNVTRDEFLDGAGFEFHEKEQILGVGFHIRDRIEKFIKGEIGISDDVSFKYVIEIYEKMFPEYNHLSQEAKIKELYFMNSTKALLVTAIYFLNNFNGNVEAKTIYIY